MTRYILILFLLMVQQVMAQPHFTRIYHTDTEFTGGYIYGKCPRIENTADGGYLLRHYVGHPIIDGEGFDYMIETKTDMSLLPQWQRKIAHSITLPDGTLFGIIKDVDTGMLIEKRNAAGTTVWQKNINSSYGGFLRLENALYTHSRIRMHGYINGSNIRKIIADIDTAGNILQADSLSGEPQFAYIEHLFADDSGNYYYVLWATGTTSLNSRKVAKVRPDNTVAWCSTWNTTAYMHKVCGMVSLPGGSVLFAGNVSSGSSDERGYLMKVSATGNIIWQKKTDRPCRPDDIGLMPNGDIAIAAGGQSFTSLTIPTEDDIIITDTDGNVKRAFNIDPNRSTWPFISGLSLPHVRSTNNWLFTALAMNPHAPIVFSTDSTGNGHCATAPVSFTFSDYPIFTFAPATISFMPILLSAGNTTLATDGTTVMYTDSCDYAQPPTATTNMDTKKIAFSPNPANNIVQIAYDNIQETIVIDALGRIVLSAPASTRQLNVADLPNGVYTVCAKVNGSTIHERLMIVH